MFRPVKQPLFVCRSVKCSVSRLDVAAERGGGDGEHGGGPAPPQRPVRGQEGPGSGDLPAQTADGSRGETCSQN